jgi:putative PIN family toxin of toxin-antitoxin system
VTAFPTVFPRLVVLDTNILVSALLTPSGNPDRVLTLVLGGDIHIVLCDEVEAEYRDVLARPHFGFNPKKTSLILDQLSDMGTWTVVSKSTIAFADEDDRVFYDLAKGTGAILVTGNIRHYPTDSAVLLPAGFLSML